MNVNVVPSASGLLFWSLSLYSGVLVDGWIDRWATGAVRHSMFLTVEFVSEYYYTTPEWQYHRYCMLCQQQRVKMRNLQ